MQEILYLAHCESPLVQQAFSDSLREATSKAATLTEDVAPEEPIVVYEPPVAYDGGEIALEVHDALRAFCEEQLNGARLKRYLREQCGLELTSEQHNIISRQDVSGLRKLQALLLAFAPPRPPRSGFTARDEFSIADKRRSAAESQRSPFRAGSGRQLTPVGLVSHDSKLGNTFQANQVEYACGHGFSDSSP